MSVENVPEVVNINTLKGRFIAHKFSSGWAVGVVKSVETKKSVAGQFAVTYTSGTYCWTEETEERRLRGRQVLGSSCCHKRA
jgi:hypothetical protein